MLLIGAAAAGTRCHSHCYCYLTAFVGANHPISSCRRQIGGFPPLPFSHSHQPGPPSSLHPFYLSFATVSGSFDAHAGCRLPCTDPSLVTLLWMLSPSPSPRLQPSQLRVRSRWGARKEQRHSLGRLSPSRDTIVDWNGGKWKEWGDQKCHLTLRQR